MRCVLLLAALILLPDSGLAASFSVPLPGLVGEIDFPRSQNTEVSFDFNQQFSEIESVWIELEAHVVASELDDCGTFLAPLDPCVHRFEPMGLWAQIDNGRDPLEGFAFSEGLSFFDDSVFDGSSPFEGVGTDVRPFRPFNPALGWDFLLAGHGDLNLFWNVVFGDPDRIVRNRTEPTGEILNARLMIEGTPIPEPSTALLFATGFLALAIRTA